MLTMKSLLRSYPEETAWRIMMRHGSERLLRAQRQSLGLERIPPPRRDIRFTRKAERARVAPTYRANNIIHDTAELFNVMVDEILGESRKRDVVLARYAAIKALRDFQRSDMTPMYSTTKIGAIFNRDHSTICYALNIFDKYYSYYEDFRENFDELKKRNLVEVKPVKVTVPITSLEDKPTASIATAEKVMSDAADIFKVTTSAIRGKKRIPPVRYARWVTARVLRDMGTAENPSHSLPTIGKLLGMHHTSVMHALSGFSVLCDQNPKVYRAYLELRRRYVTGDS